MTTTPKINYPRLKYCRINLVPKNTVEEASKLVADGCIDQDAVKSLFTRGSVGINPNLSNFGRATLANGFLQKRLTGCRNPVRPAGSEIREIIEGSKFLLTQFDLKQWSNDWELKYKSTAKPFVKSDWRRHDWLLFAERCGRVETMLLKGREAALALEMISRLDGRSSIVSLKRDYRKQSDLFERLFKFFHRSRLLVSGVNNQKRKLTGVKFLSHSTLEFNSKSASLLIDPCYLVVNGSKPDSVAEHRLDDVVADLNQHDAIFISHNHWDHCDFSTLIRINREIPFFVPRLKRESPFNPSIKNFLTSLGFKNVKEVSWWNPVKIDDITVTPCPFFGEWFGPDSQFDAFTYFIELNGTTFFGAVDSDCDQVGNMDGVYKEMRRRLPPIDVLFFGSSAQRHVAPMRCGAPWNYSNTYEKYADRMRYHADRHRVESWCRTVKPKFIVPYAEFIFENRRPRRPLKLSNLSDMDAHFKQYWSEQPKGLQNEFTRWSKSLERLKKNVRSIGIQLIMMGPQESLVV